MDEKDKRILVQSHRTSHTLNRTLNNLFIRIAYYFKTFMRSASYMKSIGNN